jgi:hypothetical protein
VLLPAALQEALMLVDPLAVLAGQAAWNAAAVLWLPLLQQQLLPG